MVESNFSVQLRPKLNNSILIIIIMIRERSSITSARLGGVGGLSQNADTADALEGGGGV